MVVICALLARSSLWGPWVAGFVQQGGVASSSSGCLGGPRPVTMSGWGNVVGNDQKPGVAFHAVLAQLKNPNDP